MRAVLGGGADGALRVRALVAVRRLPAHAPRRAWTSVPGLPLPGGVYPQPSTLDPLPSTLNPQPSTLNPQVVPPAADASAPANKKLAVEGLAHTLSLSLSLSFSLSLSPSPFFSRLNP